MLETPDYPVLSRVMRVQPRPDEKPATGFSWGDYEDVNPGSGPHGEPSGDAEGEDADDDGWGVVKSRGRSSMFLIQSRSQPSISHPLVEISSASSSQTLANKAPEALSKRQRQNAAKREAEKAGKAQAEAERLAKLAKHKRELEKAKIAEQFKGKGSTSGGMKASVDSRGKLVWE